jgi:hypothetical protein
MNGNWMGHISFMSMIVMLTWKSAIKWNTGALLVVNKVIGLEINARKLTVWACFAIRLWTQHWKYGAVQMQEGVALIQGIV